MFEVYEDAAAGYRFRFLAANGEIMTYGESYTTERDAWRAVDRLVFLITNMSHGRKLDRVKVSDLRTLNFPIRESLDTKIPRSYTWRMPYTVLDQGNEGACVGFGWAHELAARPSMIQDVTNDTGRTIYRHAQTLDPWPGEAYEGTSVQAGADFVKGQGFIEEYRWCFSVDDIVLALGYKGPVVMGVDWYDGMFTPDAEGFIRPTGWIAGGHCVMLNKVKVIKGSNGKTDPVASYVGGVNSWGPVWGINGTFKIALVDLAVLLSGGDFCVPISRHYMPVEALDDI